MSSAFYDQLMIIRRSRPFTLLIRSSRREQKSFYFSPSFFSFLCRLRQGKTPRSSKEKLTQ